MEEVLITRVNAVDAPPAVAAELGEPVLPEADFLVAEKDSIGQYVV